MCLSALTGLIGPAVSAATGLVGAQQTAQGQEQNNRNQAINEIQTLQDNAAATKASNDVLQQFMTKMAPLQTAGQAALQPEYAAIQPGAFQASQGAIGANNNAAAQSAITGTLAGGGPQLGLTNTDNGQSAAAINDATARRTQLSRNDASNYANLAAYGQNFGQLGLQEMGTNEAIDQNNNQAKSMSSILPTDEANAALQARKFIPPTDNTAGNQQIGLGSLLASNAGGIGSAASSAAKGIGSLFSNLNAPSPSNPTLNQQTGGSNPGFSVGGA